MITMPKKKPQPTEKDVMEFINRGMAAPGQKPVQAVKAAGAAKQHPVSITMSAEFIAKLDEAAATMSMNRSAFVKLAVSEYLKKMN